MNHVDIPSIKVRGALQSCLVTKNGDFFGKKQVKSHFFSNYATLKSSPDLNNRSMDMVKKSSPGNDFKIRVQTSEVIITLSFYPISPFEE